MASKGTNPSPKYAIIVNCHQKFTGRLIGVIDDEECKALINMKGAARKVATSEGISKPDLDGKILSKRRFVIVTEDITKGKREVFISPKIEYATISRGKKGWRCKDNNDYYFEEVV
jgi:hypothetical protein